MAGQHGHVHMLDVAIIGGGLAGLSLALHLQRFNAGGKRLQFAVHEASQRWGGRILSIGAQPDNPDSRHDLGPTWFWPAEQPLMVQFCQHHGLDLFLQWQSGAALFQTDRLQPPQRFNDAQPYSGAYRIQGGTQRLIDVLLQQLPADCLVSGSRLTALRDAGDHVEMVVNTLQGEQRLQSRKVALCLPPRLVTNRVHCTPVFDTGLQQLMQATPTWMAGHAKVIVRYAQPFWRDSGLSGSAFAQYPGAMLGEIFDACDASGHFAALGAFMALPAELRSRFRDDLEALIVEQLLRLFGPPAAAPLEVIIQDWFREEHLAVDADAELPLQHPHYGHRWLRLDHWNEKLWFAGTETDDRFGGYLEGALRSAQRVAQDIIAPYTACPSASPPSFSGV